jgi:hypothetical protein
MAHPAYSRVSRTEKSLFSHVIMVLYETKLEVADGTFRGGRIIAYIDMTGVTELGQTYF